MLEYKGKAEGFTEVTPPLVGMLLLADKCQSDRQSITKTKGDASANTNITPETANETVNEAKNKTKIWTLYALSQQNPLAFLF